MQFASKTFVFVLLLLSSCTKHSEQYYSFYSHLNVLRQVNTWQPMVEDDYFLIILVDARHLDYSNEEDFFRSIAKHPSDGSKNRDVGHAWIYLQGRYHDNVFAIEGGHSGEIEEPPVRYFDGVMNYNDWGYANPSCQQVLHPRYEPNPIKYLWTEREDGFFQKGSGGHIPTFAAKIRITQQQFKCLLQFIKHYDYRHYALLNKHCCSFVKEVAFIAGLDLDSQISMNLSPQVHYGNCLIRLWEDPAYSVITFASPDQIEKSLIDAVTTGNAEYALDWYLNRQ